eukprot:7530804-Pyramimonas_sp.AAC.1
MTRRGQRASSRGKMYLPTRSSRARTEPPSAKRLASSLMMSGGGANLAVLEHRHLRVVDTMFGSMRLNLDMHFGLHHARTVRCVPDRNFRCD